jgi:hypothetical protein
LIVVQRNLQNPERDHRPREECNESTKTKLSLRMAENGAVKGPRQIVVEMKFVRAEEGVGAELVRYHR